MAEPSPFHRECCSRMLSALADEQRTTLVVMVKPPARRRKFPLWTATVTDPTGRLLAACRHEIGPFDNDEHAQRLQKLMWGALTT